MKQIALISVLALSLAAPIFAHAADHSMNNPGQADALGSSDTNLSAATMADNNSAALPDVGPDLAANSLDDKIAPTDGDMD